MAWVHYETDIVRAYGVKLDGWPIERIELLRGHSGRLEGALTTPKDAF